MTRQLVALLCSLAGLLAAAPAEPAASAAIALGPAVMPGSDLPPMAGGTATVPDPDGTRPWTVSAARSSDGRLCAKVVRRGKTAVGRCWRLADGGSSGTYVRQHGERTIVYGVVASKVSEVALLGAHARDVVVTRRGRAFATVVDGRVDPHLLPVRVTLRDGTTRTQDWGAAWKVEALDPVTGGRWLLTAGTRRLPQSVCAGVESPDDGVLGGARITGQGYCFDLTRSRFGVTRLPLGVRGAGSPFSPVLRTVVLGVADQTVRSVELVTPAGPRPLELSEKGNGFIAVLSGPDPTAVRVTYADGTTETTAGTVALSGMAIA